MVEAWSDVRSASGGRGQRRGDTMKWATRDRLVSRVAVLLPAVVLFALGRLYLAFANFKEPDPDRWAPYLIPGFVGLMAGLSSGLLVRVAFPYEADREELHLFFSILATFALVISFCLWWGDWAIR